MKLVALSQDVIRPGEALPFDLRDADGRLLLAAGTRPDPGVMATKVASGHLFADEADCQEWQRRLGRAMDAKLLQNASLRDIVSARPDAGPARVAQRDATVIEQWTELMLGLDALLRDMAPDVGWPQRLLALQERVFALYDRRPDASLYWLIFHCAHSTEHYSSYHALLCALIVRDTARMLDWLPDDVRSLTLAALTMNASMRKLQDRLASTEMRLSADVRAEIASHAERSARMLERAGVVDLLMVGIVRAHHDDKKQHLLLAQLDPAQRCARLLRRVDIFTAKLSRRHDRLPMSPMQAAREACFGAGGLPDEIGGALLKAIGFYPPGSFVELHSGEIGIVIARGRQANMPTVAALVSAARTPLGVPAVRDSRERRFAIKGPVGTAAVRVVPPHEMLLALR